MTPLGATAAVLHAASLPHATAAPPSLPPTAGGLRRTSGDRIPLLLVLGLAIAWPALAAPVVCPTLPPLPANATTFALTASTFEGADASGTRVQFLAYNASRGWGPTLRMRLGGLYQIDLYNADIEVRSTLVRLCSDWSEGRLPGACLRRAAAWRHHDCARPPAA